VTRPAAGKLYFPHLWDWTGHPATQMTQENLEYQTWSSRIQVMLGARQVGETGWKLAQELDLGDLIGVEGAFGKTRTGEPTIFADGLKFLGKSLSPQPEKFHGMSDMEFRLRHRYLDLIYTPDTLDRARKR